MENKGKKGVKGVNMHVSREGGNYYFPKRLGGQLKSQKIIGHAVILEKYRTAYF
jgi:hypothetical protein